jgi:tetratricopeptide (TPR) repeat protein
MVGSCAISTTRRVPNTCERYFLANKEEHTYYPIRQSLGAALLKAGRNAEAEAVYREDLKRFPENGWSLFGLAAALRAQGKSGDAEAVDQRFAKAWSAADVKLVASRF